MAAAKLRLEGDRSSLMGCCSVSMRRITVMNTASVKVLCEYWPGLRCSESSAAIANEQLWATRTANSIIPKALLNDRHRLLVGLRSVHIRFTVRIDVTDCIVKNIR